MKRIAAFILACSVLVYAQGNSWDKVRYNGGTLQTKVDPKDWGNHLTVTSDLIVFKLKDGQSVQIQTHSVTGLSYGQEAHRRVGTMVALGIIITPLALFGLFHKTRLHFIGIEYVQPDGKKAGLLLQAHKDNYRAILMALKSATGAPLAVSDKDREYVPTGIAATTTKEAESSSAAPSQAPTDDEVSVAVSSTPSGAEIYVDGAFVGSAPSTLKLAAGKHTVRLAEAGYKDWTREIAVTAGSNLTLSASMEKSP